MQRGQAAREECKYLDGFRNHGGKNSESSDPDERKCKHRVVFAGDRVRDIDFVAAIVQALGSAPATMEASKCVDAIGFCPGDAAEEADAAQAYTQARYDGEKTWVQLLEDMVTRMGGHV